MKIPLIGPSSESRSLTADAQRTINLYGETIESGTGKNKRVLYGKPGLAVAATLGRRATAVASMNSRMFVVANSHLTEINTSTFGVVGTVAGIVDDPSYASTIVMNARSGPNDLDFLIVGAGGVCYFFHDGGSASAIILDDITATVSTDGIEVESSGEFDIASMPHGTGCLINGVSYTIDFVANAYTLYLTGSAGTQTSVPFVVSGPALLASSACVLDGYAIISRPGTRQVNISKLDDFSSWDPLDFALKEGYSDDITRVLANAPQLWLIGGETIEIWRDVGNADFPFQRDPAGLIHMGSSEPQSWVTMAGIVYGLCSDTRGGLVAYRFNGYTPQRISTHAQEDAWEGEANVTAFAFQMDGHYFWQINGSVISWTYDATENEWTERGLLNTTSGNTFYRDIPECHTYVGGKHVVSGYNDANLYEMSLANYDDAGTAIRCVRRLPHICSEKKHLVWHRLVLEVETGQTTSTEPQMELRISRDGGKTYQTTGVTQGMGTTGDTLKRLVYRQLGAGRDIVPEIAVTSHSKVAIIDAYGEVTEGTI